MPLTVNQPDSKYQETTKISPSSHKAPLIMAHSNGKEEIPLPDSIKENKTKNDSGALQPDSHTIQSVSSNPPPLEPIPPSSFPGESAKIYAGMPPLISSSSLPHSGTTDSLHPKEYEKTSGTLNMASIRNSQGNILHTFPVPSNATMSTTSNLLMPPPPTSIKTNRSNAQDNPAQTGQVKHKLPDSSHDLYSSRPSSSSYHFHGFSSMYQKQSRFSDHSAGQHSNHRTHPSCYDPVVGKHLLSTTGGALHMNNGDRTNPSTTGEWESKATEDSGEIINVDEDVDLESMYLDLITEEYTATVKR